MGRSTAARANGWVSWKAGSVPLHLLLGALVLTSVALLYGRPFIFHDSGTYLHYGAHIVDEIGSLLRGVPPIVHLDEFELDYLGGRSPTYSALLYLIRHKSSLWGLVAVQALTASWLLYTFGKSFGQRHYQVLYYWGTIAILTLASSLPYYVAYAMPDVFTGLGALALMLLMVSYDRLTGVERVLAWIVLAAATSFHVSNIVSFVVATAVGVLTANILQLASRRRNLTAFTWAMAALLIGASSGPVYRQIERDVFHHSINAPPFLTARLLADGPGAEYIREQCSKARHFAICNYAVRPPVNAGRFIWGSLDQGGGYAAADAMTRRALVNEQLSFASQVILSRPLEQALASAKNWVVQLSMIEVKEPVRDPRTSRSYSAFDEVHNEASISIPEALLERLRQAVVLVSTLALISILACAGGAKHKSPGVRRMIAVFVITATILIVNAAVCGAISHPYDRYQARVIWLLPAILLLSATPSVAARIAADAEIAAERAEATRPRRRKGSKCNS